MLNNERILIGTFLVVFDLLGTFVFALSGAAAGVRRGLDVFGVLVVGFAAATAGGITRDLMIGAVPPVGISDWRYITVSVFAGLLTFAWTWFRAPSTLGARIVAWPRLVNRLTRVVLVLDAAGLGLFAVTGALKALAYHLAPVAAVLMGVITAVGGGVLRDVLVTEVPMILRPTVELYAMAALAGAIVVVVGRLLGVATPIVGVAGALLCFTLRILAIRRGWRLPSADAASSAAGRGA